jgi:hypothetical protein
MGHHAPPLEIVCSVGVIIVTCLACAGKGVAMMLGGRYIKRVDASGTVYEVMGRRNDAGSEPTWLLRATDGSRREEYVTDDALRQEWMRV